MLNTFKSNSRLIIFSFFTVLHLACLSCQESTKTEKPEKESALTLEKQIEQSNPEKEEKTATYLSENESIVFQFELKNGKMMVLAQNEKDNYLVYRFGSKEKIELEFPAKKDASSWKLFEYSYWLRGGGPQNAGMDINFLAFTNNGFKYVIYDTYHSEDEDEQSEIGIKVIDLKTKKETVFKGVYDTRKGNIIHFRDNSKVTQSETLYE